jgi:WD40 repeat protein
MSPKAACRTPGHGKSLESDSLRSAPVLRSLQCFALLVLCVVESFALTAIAAESSSWAQHIQVYRTLPQKLLTRGLAWSPDGTRIAALDGFGTGIYVWDATNGQRLFYTSVPGIVSPSLAFVDDGRSLIVPASISDRQTSVIVYDISSAQISRRIDGLIPDKNSAAQNLALSQDQHQLAILTVGNLTEVSVYSTRAWSIERAVKVPSVEGPMVFSPDGKYLAIAGIRSDIFITSSTGEQSVQTFKVQPADVTALAFRPEGRSLLVGVGNLSTVNSGLSLEKVHELARHKVREVDVSNSATLREIDEAIDDVRSISFHPSGQFFAVGGGDSVWLFDAESFALISRLGGFKHVWSVAFDPKGRYLAVGSEGLVTIFRSNAMSAP